VFGGGLENRYPSLGGSRVRIPPPPPFFCSWGFASGPARTLLRPATDHRYWEDRPALGHERRAARRIQPRPTRRRTRPSCRWRDHALRSKSGPGRGAADGVQLTARPSKIRRIDSCGGVDRVAPRVSFRPAPRPNSTKALSTFLAESRKSPRSRALPTPLLTVPTGSGRESPRRRSPQARCLAGRHPVVGVHVDVCGPAFRRCQDSRQIDPPAGVAGVRAVIVPSASVPSTAPPAGAAKNRVTPTGPLGELRCVRRGGRAAGARRRGSTRSRRRSRRMRSWRQRRARRWRPATRARSERLHF
jgi:hypothetical protein